MKESPPSPGAQHRSEQASKQALNREEDSKSECLLQIILGEYRLSSPNPAETQNPYSKEEPLQSTDPSLFQCIFQPSQSIHIVHFPRRVPKQR